MKKVKIKAWAITDWGGGITHPSVSIFDTKKEAYEGLKKLNEIPDPIDNKERNKIVSCEICYIE